MSRQEDLERRVAALEQELAALKGRGLRVIRKRASWGIGDLPFYSIAVGGDPAKGEWRGHAKGIVAIGDIATGVLAIGGWARGVVALGGLATGLVSFGGLALGVLLAFGGLAIGGVAVGGGAVGGVAVGGGAAGYYACGGGAVGQYVVAEGRRDREAEALFAELGVRGLCPPAGWSRQRWPDR